MTMSITAPAVLAVLLRSTERARADFGQPRHGSLAFGWRCLASRGSKRMVASIAMHMGGFCRVTCVFPTASAVSLT